MPEKKTKKKPTVKVKLSKPKTANTKKVAKKPVKKIIKKAKIKTTRSVKKSSTPIKTRKAKSKKIIKLKRPIIKVKNLVKKYGDKTVVDGVSFEVKEGEVFGILGPNGAGKTTIMEIIETLIQKTSGEVKVDGFDVDIYPEQIKKLIGVQLQEGGFLPDLNLTDILRLFTDIYNVRVNITEILAKVGLVEKSKSYYSELSGGQKQRFSVASTLVADPVIMFLDEPTTGLDPQARHNLWDLILDLKKKGKTIVLTTHYMDEAEQLCDRIAIIDNGKMLEINTAEGFINELVSKGFERPKAKLKANLEDVFLDKTGKNLRN